MIVNIFFKILPLAAATFAARLSSRSAADGDGWTMGTGYGNATVRYREVPASICELAPGVKSYTGYVDLAPEVHMFFWLFEARHTDPTTAPLTTWISGGPGDSSMSELFTEHGPCRVEPDGGSIVSNPFSWNNYSNVVYIDQPVQVGFSYTKLQRGYVTADQQQLLELGPDDDCPDSAFQCGDFSINSTDTTANSTENAAPNFWLTLQSLFSTFPQFAQNGFHFGSESYGGHYVPVFSKYIQEQNSKNLSGAHHIDLQSVLVGNGWFSPKIQLESYYNYGFVAGTPYGLPPLSDKTKQEVHDAYYGKDQCLDQLNECNSPGSTDDQCQTADHYCDHHVQKPWKESTQRDDQDIREKKPSPFPNEYYAQPYLQNSSVRAAIGAVQTYVEFNPTVGIAFDNTGDDARELDIVQTLGELVASGVRVTLYAGDADYQCNWLGVEAVAQAVGAPDFDEAGYVDIVTPDNVTHGQVKQSAGFSFVRVYQAGHAVGAFQPLLQQTIFLRTITGKDLSTGTDTADHSYYTRGTPNSTYIEGNATVLDQQVQDPNNVTYNYTSNLPSQADFQPFWDGPIISPDCC